MTMTPDRAYRAKHAKAGVHSPPRNILLRLLRRLDKSDQLYRNRQKFRQTPVEWLVDMGITPEDVRRIFER